MPTLRERLFWRQYGLCWICLKPMKRDGQRDDPWVATFDHVQALSRSGANRPRNKLLAHEICNKIRGRGVHRHGESTRLIVARAFSRIGEAAKRRGIERGTLKV